MIGRCFKPSETKLDFGHVQATLGWVGGIGIGAPGPAKATVLGWVGGIGIGAPGPAKATVLGWVGGIGIGAPGPAKATVLGWVGGIGIGAPGPEATATLVETVKTAARMANWNLMLFKVMDV
jgi:hypothetical protein